MNKKIILVLAFFVFLLVSCNNNNVKEVSIDVIESSIPSIVYVDEFEISDILIKVEFESGDSDNIRLSEDMLSTEDYNKFSQVGNHDVTVRIKELTDTFSINVKAKRVTSINVSGEKEVFEGEQITLIATPVPNDASVEFIWISLNPEIASVNNNGVVTGIKGGIANIKVSSKDKPNIETLYNVEVKHSFNCYPIIDLKNYEIIIMAPSQTVFEYDPFSEYYTQLDKEEKIASWEDVQNIYNVRFTVKGYPKEADTFGPQRVNWLIEKALENQTLADIVVSYSDWIPTLVDGDAMVDLKEFYDKYGQFYAYKAYLDAGTYKDGIYALPMSTITTNKVNHGLFFNVNLLESLNLENPAKLFNEGKWTWSRFEEYITDAATKLGEDESVLSGKPVNLYLGMSNAANISLVDNVNRKLNLKDPTVVEVAQIIQDMYKISNVWGSNSYDTFNESFNSGKSIFQISEYRFLERPGYPENMWGDDTRYGYVPFPYPDTFSKEDTRTNYEGGLVYQIPKGRVYSDGIYAENIFYVFTKLMNWTTKRVLENPETSEELILASIVSHKLDDQESIKAMTYFNEKKLIYDPFFRVLPVWSHTGQMIDQVVVDGNDYLEVIDSYEDDLYLIINNIYG